MNNKLLSVLILVTLFAGHAVKAGSFGRWSSRFYNSNMYNNRIFDTVRNKFILRTYEKNKEYLISESLKNAEKIVKDYDCFINLGDYNCNIETKNDAVSKIEHKLVMTKKTKSNYFNNSQNTPECIQIKQTIMPKNNTIHVMIVPNLSLVRLKNGVIESFIGEQHYTVDLNSLNEFQEE